jgi:hypothetical protein
MRALIRTLVCAALVLLALAAPAAAQPKTDVVILVNGDKFTGEIKNVSRGRLTLSTDDAGTISIEWNKVAWVSSKYQFEVSTDTGRRYIGSLAQGPDGKVAVVGSAGDTVVALSVFEIFTIYQLRATFWEKLDGSLNLGASYAQSSGVGQLTFDGKVTFRRPSFTAYTTVSAGLTQQTDEPDTSRLSVQFGYTRFYENQWVLNPLGLFESNPELGFDLRSSAAVTVGRYLRQSSSGWILLGVGGSVGREQPVDGETTTNVDALIALNASRFTYDFPKTNFDFTLLVFPSLNDFGRVRINANVTWSRELIKDFNLTFSAYDSYDNRPPTEGARKNDLGFSLSLGWTF